MPPLVASSKSLDFDRETLLARIVSAACNRTESVFGYSRLFSQNPRFIFSYSGPWPVKNQIKGFYRIFAQISLRYRIVAKDSSAHGMTNSTLALDRQILGQVVVNQVDQANLQFVLIFQVVDVLSD